MGAHWPGTGTSEAPVQTKGKRPLVETAQPRAVARVPRWPLIVAPLVGFVYYVALREAFATAIREVVWDIADLTANHLGNIPMWGTHWLYRSIAEVTSVAFGTFVAGSIARERARAAAIVAGCTISIVYILRFVVLIWALDRGDLLVDPWYQVFVDGAVIMVAPVIGYGVGTIELSQANGFAALPRAHFLWLWIPSFLYGRSLVGPIMREVSSSFVNLEASVRSRDTDLAGCRVSDLIEAGLN